MRMRVSAGLLILSPVVLLAGCGLEGAYLLQYAAMAPAIPTQTKLLTGGMSGSSHAPGLSAQQASEDALARAWSKGEGADPRVTSLIKPCDNEAARAGYTKLATRGESGRWQWSCAQSGHSGWVEATTESVKENGRSCKDVAHAFFANGKFVAGRRGTACVVDGRWVELEHSGKAIDASYSASSK